MISLGFYPQTVGSSNLYLPPKYYTFNQWVLKLCVGRKQLVISVVERERKTHRDPPGN